MNMDVVKNIIEIRTEKRIKQEVLADALNVDTSVISKIEKGVRQLRVNELAIIAKVLDVDLLYLFTYPKRYVDEKSIQSNDRVSITFEVATEKRDFLLGLVAKNGIKTPKQYMQVAEPIEELKKKIDEGDKF